MYNRSAFYSKALESIGRVMHLRTDIKRHICWKYSYSSLKLTRRPLQGGTDRITWVDRVPDLVNFFYFRHKTVASLLALFLQNCEFRLF